ncbi:hypothetical protein M885DRAFT_619857 [Pelagophyceae sp. CCMP2097]|nr:hypothetical protein M885DRAFT_619857 [Pelagophyceae sp. CCMP2097]
MLSRLTTRAQRGLPRAARPLSAFKDAYQAHVDERLAQGIVPTPLDAKRTAALVEELKNPTDDPAFLLNLFSQRVPPGVDEAACVKASFLAAVAKGDATTPLIDKKEALRLLGTMVGGYNVGPLIEALSSKDPALAAIAVEALSKMTLVFDSFNDVDELRVAGNASAAKVMQAWADAEWFLSKPDVPKMMSVTVFKVTGETNTDDLSPAPDAWSRPDIPLHALAMLKNPRDGIEADVAAQIAKLGEKGFPLAYVGDVVGTGSSRKSATNSVLWYMGDDVPYVPNKRGGGVCIGSSIAPIFFNTMEDAGSLPIEMDVSAMNMGDVIDVFPFDGIATKHGDKTAVLASFKLKTQVLFDEVRAGGRIPLIIGRALTAKARAVLGLPASDTFRTPVSVGELKGYTLGQKMVGKACGVRGVAPGAYCEPLMTTVGSQDTTGPMTRDELKDLACLGFSADLVMQSFCHTAAYPKPVDVVTHATLPDFIRTRGGVSLRPGDGIIHSWLNRMLLPDTVGTGGDSHTRFPIGISFPAGSGLVAFAAATGVMPLDMPESVLVRFTGTMQPGITLRDLVHAIPYAALQRGLLTVEKAGKKNVFSGRVLEIEGLAQLKCEQAFELSDASAERSAAGCTIKLDKEPIIEYLMSNVTMLKWMIAEGYGDVRSLERRIARMQQWLAEPVLMEADKDAVYFETIEINLDDIKEPILCAPNDPDDARPLSACQDTPVDEVFLGSCMTNIGHFRAAGKLLDAAGVTALPTKLWVAPPTKMDAAQLTEEGYYSIYGKVGARTEMPGCSLCMGNQARVADRASVVSTSTRNFPNRLGKGANVFLASAEMAAVAAILGRLPKPAEYLEMVKSLDTTAADTYRYLNFDQLPKFVEAADGVEISDKATAQAKSMAAH